MNNSINILKLISKSEKDIESKKYISSEEVFNKLEKKLSTIKS